MPAVNDVGEPCAGEPHARFDGRGLETGRKHYATTPAPDPTSTGAAGAGGVSCKVPLNWEDRDCDASIGTSSRSAFEVKKTTEGGLNRSAQQLVELA